MSVLYPIFLALVCFLVFSIGLNLGMHGILNTTPSFNSFISTSTFESQSSTSSDINLQTNTNYIKDNSEISTKPGEIVLISNTPLPLADIENTALRDTQNLLNSDVYRSYVSQVFQQAKSDQFFPISSYLSKGESLPVLLMACNRPELLTQTLKSLLSVKGIQKDNIITSQDGNMPEVASLVKSNGLKLIQNLEGLHLRGGVPLDGAQRIARHYKYSITEAFKNFPNAPAIIIVEDDLLFSPDFYDYFVNAVPALEQDPTLFLVSAWNDNGFKGKVKEPFALRRTEFFPGLGWLLPRKLYERELERAWPNEHWDHWLRSQHTHKGREIVYPQVPRTYHNGIKGTFMNLDTHNRYFRDIDYNTRQELVWPSENVNIPPPAAYVSSDAYESRIQTLIKSCQHVSTVQELKKASGIVCIWIDINPDPSYQYFHGMAEFFGIWHEHHRGSHRGMHEFYWNDKYILLINVHPIQSLKSYAELKPPSVELATSFDKKLYKRMISDHVNYEVVASSLSGVSCDRICRDKGKSCQSDLLPLVNTCDELIKHYPCQECEPSYGLEQPAYVNPSASKEHHPGMCLVNSRPDESDCHSSHPVTMRLCTCV